MNLNDPTPVNPPPMTPEQIADACEIAAEILEGNWVQGRWATADGRYCIEGALSAAMGWNADLEHDSLTRTALQGCEVYEAVRETINLQTNRQYGSEGLEYVDRGDLPGWNDNDNRVEQEVLDVLHHTAKRVLGVDL